MNRLALAALAAVFVVASSSADARPRVRHGHVQRTQVMTVTQFCGDRYCAGDARALHNYARPAHKYAARGMKRRQIADGTPWSAGPTWGSSVVQEARRYIGGNPTGRSSLWCATFMNYVLEHTGHRGTGSNAARSFASYGTRIAGPQVGAIAVMSRGKRGGHVGVVSGITPGGDPIIISGNHGRRVAESVYPASRPYAYVLP